MIAKTYEDAREGVIAAAEEAWVEVSILDSICVVLATWVCLWIRALPHHGLFGAHLGLIHWFDRHVGLRNSCATRSQFKAVSSVIVGL